jgi:molybdate transport system substrate-binding protein
LGIEILSAGAAQGVVTAFAERFRAQSGHAVDGTFGAVGAIRERLLGGAVADIVILTRAMIGELARDGHVRHETCADLGAVRTAIAVKQGEPLPDISSAAALRELLRSARGLYFPDPQRATAGIHFAKRARRARHPGRDAIEAAPVSERGDRDARNGARRRRGARRMHADHGDQ